MGTLYIQRAKGGARIKALLHKIADVQGGITINKESLSGDVLYEGTPFGYGEGKLFEIVKTAAIVDKANSDAKNYKIAKGHHFSAGDSIAIEGGESTSEITKIDKSDVSFDLVTVKATIGVAEEGAVMFETDGKNAESKIDPIGVTGDDNPVVGYGSLLVNAWLFAVAKSEVCPPVTKDMEKSMKGVIYQKVLK